MTDESLALRALLKLARRGVKLVISDAQEGIKATVYLVLSATWERCQMQVMGNALVHAGKTQGRVVSDFVETTLPRKTRPRPRPSGAR